MIPVFFLNSEILKLTAFKFLITQNKYGRAVCGMEKLFLEFTAVGDLGEK
jgi:hypothetical protein